MSSQNYQVRGAGRSRGPSRGFSRTRGSRGNNRGNMRSSAPRPNENIDTFKLIKMIQTIINDEKYLPLTATSAKEIIESIKGTLYYLNIKMTYENLSCLEKIEKVKLAFRLKDKNEFIRFENITSIDQIIPRFRILLATNRYKANFQIPLVKQSNGIVLEIAEVRDKLKCTVLVLPPNDFNPNFTHSVVEEQMSKNEYDIYEINDGTTLNIYYDPHYLHTEIVTQLRECEHEDKDKEESSLKTYKIYKMGKWMRSTRNAFDIDELVWRGFSYKKIIDDVLSQYPDFHGDDINYVYSIGFKHPAFHPFGQPQEWKTLPTLATTPISDASLIKWIKYAWLIQVFDRSIFTVMDANTPSSVANIGLPLQKKVSTENLTFLDMIKKADNSLKDFLHPANSEQKDDVKPFLGYILRSKNNSPDILLESDLWNTIRHAIYQLPFTPNKAARERQEQNFKNMQYIIVDSFLDIKKRQTFMHLFPQYEYKYEYLDRVLTQLVERVYDDLYKKYKKEKVAFCIELESYDDSPEQKEKKNLELLVARLAPVIGEHYKPVLITDQTQKPDQVIKSDKKMIKTLLFNPKFTDIYMSILDI
jgi:hypothetical protein